MRRLPLLLLLIAGFLLPAVPAEAATPYRWTSRTIDASLAQRMQYSYRAGCPVPLRNLRYMTVTFIGFDAQPHVGALVVNADAVPTIARVFQKLYASRFQIRRMHLVDDYRGDDDASMAADNTSAFNCRRVTGSTSWSQHAYGRAVDINPVENPYVQGGVVRPPAGAPYVRRTPLRQGMMTGVAIDAFRVQSWAWGGNWRNSKDYQHFSRTGT